MTMRPKRRHLHDSIAHALVAFDVELDTGGILLLDDGAVALKAVVGDGEEGAAQRVEVGDGRRVGMVAAALLAQRSCSLDTERSACTSARARSGRYRSVWQSREEFVHVVVGSSSACGHNVTVSLTS